jgi:hypothetical protein
MAVGLYDTARLIAVVEQMKRPSSFLLDTFFPNISTSLTEKVLVDVFVNKRRMAPFVSPLAEAKFIEQIGVTTNEFKPAYIKQLDRVDPFKPIRRAIGEQIGGLQMTPAEREQVNLDSLLAQQIMMIDRRLEWMAAQALVNGYVDITGDNYPTQRVDYQRDSSLTVALTGTARWNISGAIGSTAAPSANLTTWSALILKASGLPSDTVIFTPAAWEGFRQDPRVSQIVLSPQNGVPDLVATAARPAIGGQFLGTWGQFKLFLYYDWYVDPADGVEKPMIPDGTVILGSSQLNGERAFASVIDAEVGYAALPYAPKSYTTQNPGTRWLLTQSAPLVIPTQVNAAAAITVA